jgi:hypothetical protein
LAQQPASIHRVAADCLVLYNLFLDNVSPGKKLSSLNTVIDWKLNHERPDLRLVESAFASSIGNPGPGYLMRRPWQLGFYIEFSRSIVAHKIDPFSFAACKKLANDVKAKVQKCSEAPNILLHLLFPDDFERIASDAHKEQIVSAFRAEAEGAQDLDDALRNIRRALGKKFNRPYLDFYQADLLPLWQADAPPPASPRYWVEKTLVRGRSDREDGPHALGKAVWSPQRSEDGRKIYENMRQLRPGDRVLHFVDNESLAGVSIVEGPADESFVGLENTPWARRSGYRVPLTQFERLNPVINRSEDPRSHTSGSEGGTRPDFVPDGGRCRPCPAVAGYRDRSKCGGLTRTRHGLSRNHSRRSAIGG